MADADFIKICCHSQRQSQNTSVHKKATKAREATVSRLAAEILYIREDLWIYTPYKTL